jgi:ATP-dependent Lon protease
MRRIEQALKQVFTRERIFIWYGCKDHAEMEADSLLIQVQALQVTVIDMDYEIEPQGTQHARSIETDTGWKILLDRGLDIFQRYDYKDAFNLANALQEERMCKGVEVTYVKSK